MRAHIYVYMYIRAEQAEKKRDGLANLRITR